MKSIKNCMLILFCLASCVIGCKKEVEQKIPNADEIAVVCDFRGLKTDGGILLFEQGLLSYYDENTDELVPVCTRADCSHTPVWNRYEATCPAALLYHAGNAVGLYKNKLWYIRAGEVDLSDNSLYCADVNGENDREVYSLPTYLGADGTMIFVDDGLYFVGSTMVFDELGVYVGDEQCIIGIDLNSGLYQMIVEPFVSERECYSLLGANGDWIYYHCAADTVEEYPDGAILRWNRNTKKTEKVKLDTGRLCVCVKGEGYFVYEIETANGYKSMIYWLDSQKNETITETEAMIFGYSAFEEEIIYFVMENGWYSYSLKDKKTELLRNGDLDASFGVTHSTDGGYLLQVSIDRQLFYTYVSKEKFNAGSYGEILADWKLPDLENF